MSKGDKRRPSQTGSKEFATNWDKAFGPKKKPKPKKKSTRLSRAYGKY